MRMSFTKKTHCCIDFYSDFNRLKVVSSKAVLLFLFMVCNAKFDAFAQPSKMFLFSIEPEWNKKSVCDLGSGYDPSPINAPSMSYSGGSAEEPSYDFTWEVKINNGEWSEVTSGHEVKFVPSLNPAIIYNSEAGTPVVNYAWRLKIKDLANRNLSAESDVYTLKVASLMKGIYTVSDTKDSKLKSIDLTVTGGLSTKKYTWSSIGSKNSFPSSQINTEDPSGLSAGVYQVIVNDEACRSLTLKVDTANPTQNKNQ